MLERLRIEVIRSHNTFAGPLHPIPTEKLERKGGERSLSLPPSGASESVWRSHKRLPRRLAGHRGQTCACVGRHRVAAPPVRPDRRADIDAADVRVVHQRSVHERRGRRCTDHDSVGGETRLPGRRLLGRVRLYDRRRLLRPVIPDDARLSVGAGETDNVRDRPPD